MDCALGKDVRPDKNKQHFIWERFRGFVNVPLRHPRVGEQLRQTAKHAVAPHSDPTHGSWGEQPRIILNLKYFCWTQLGKARKQQPVNTTHHHLSH